MQKSTITLLILALSSAGVSAGLWMELRTERALNAELSARLDAAIAARRVAPAPAVARVAQALSTAPATWTPTPAPTAPAQQPEAARESMVDWPAYQRRLMKDPKYREAWREEQRLQLAQRRENYIKLLGFTPEQADAAIDLAIDRQMNWPGGIPQEHGEEEMRAYQAKLREVLGEEKYTRLQTYMDSRQTRMQVDRFRTQLTGEDALRDDQVEPLISALYGEQSQMQEDLQRYRESLGSETDQAAALRKLSEQETELLKAAHGRMHSAAAGILSSSQLDKFDATLKRELERHEAQQRLLRIRAKIDPTDPKSSSN
jgi:hypothetical protein